MTSENEDTGDRPSPGEGEVTLFEILAALLRRWRVMLGLPLALGLLAAAVSLVLHPVYTATTTFTTDLSSNAISGSLGGLPGLAGQFGLSGFSGSNTSPEFFAAVLKSRELLTATLRSRFRDPVATGSDSTRPLLDLLDIKGDDEEKRINNGVRFLEKHIATRVDKRAGIVVLTVEGRPAILAASVANRMVELLNQFNLERRQFQSRAQRRFVGERLAQAQQELRKAEADHLHFLQANRRYSDSPLLAFEASRLERSVQLRQEIFVTLSREYEQARIAEVRDTPVLTIIDAAAPPDRRSFPQRKLLVLVTVMLGSVVALAFVYFDESRAAAERSGRRDYDAFRQAWQRARAEIGALVHRPRVP